MDFIPVPTAAFLQTPLFAEYLCSMTGFTDDFWESFLLKSETFLLEQDGFCMLHPDFAGRTAVVAFYIVPRAQRASSRWFDFLLREKNVLAAFCATCDERFLALCLDRHTKIEMQAYFFLQTERENVRPPEFPLSCMRLCPPEEYASIMRATDGFYDEKELHQAGVEMYALEKDGTPLGYGEYNPCQIRKGCVCLGNYAMPEARKRGVGRSLLMNMAEIARKNGQIPGGGCWYYNHNSRRTMNSAGFVSVTRYLHICLGPNEPPQP